MHDTNRPRTCFIKSSNSIEALQELRMVNFTAVQRLAGVKAVCVLPTQDQEPRCRQTRCAFG